jgi:Fic family protein
MKQSFKRIDELVVKLQSLKPLSSEARQKLDRKFRLEFNFNSNHLEGNTLTYGETELLLIFDDTRGNHSMREYEEMKAHDAAYLLIEEWAKDKERPLTEQNIKNLNEIILVRPFWKDAITADGQDTRRKIKVGNYKEHPNSVRLQNGELFEYASPSETPIMMQELIDSYRSEEDSAHPITLAAMLHYRFVRIHPFDDGNGRIARLLMNYVLLKNDLPPVIIKSKNKVDYLRALHAADVGDFATFIDYIGEQEEWSLELSIKAALGESIEEPEDWEKELVLMKQELGQEKNSKVELKYTEEIFKLIVRDSLTPFVKLWQAKMDTFDSLFNYRKCEVSMTSSKYATFSKFENSLINGWEQLLEKLSEKGGLTASIKLSCLFEGMIIPTSEKRFSGGIVKIYFHDNSYQLTFSDIIPKKIFPYSHILSKEEISEIVNTLSRNLMQSIKEATN